MEDVLSAHAARCAQASAEYLARAKAAREEGDAAIRAAVAAFGARVLEITRDLDAAGADISAKLYSAVAETGVKLAAAYDDNVAAIALSTSAAQAELETRAAFVATGKLPTGVEPLPRAQGVDLTFSDHDAPTAEIVLLKHPAAALEETNRAPAEASA